MRGGGSGGGGSGDERKQIAEGKVNWKGETNGK